MLKKALLLSVLAFAAGVSQSQTITIDVTPALAPNAFGSPSYTTWYHNATYALEHGLSSYGDPASPTYYEAIDGAIPLEQAIVTGFNSWYGVADPGTFFGPAFALELGTRPSFGIVVRGNGVQISIDNLSFSASSSDPGNLLGFSFGAGSYVYSEQYYGIIFGPGGEGSPGATYVTSGPANQLVDMIVGRGSGSAFAIYDDGNPATTHQDEIDAGKAALPQSFTFTGTYSMPDGAGTATGSTSVQVVPEPGIFGLISLGFAGLMMRRRRSLLKD